MKKLSLPQLYAHLGNPQILSFAGNLTVSALGIISVSLLYHTLPVRDNGIWIIFNSVVGLADAFRSGFLTTAFIRACSGATAQRASEVIGSAWGLALAITAGLALLNLGAWLLLGHRPADDLTLILHWSGIVLVATLPYFMATCVMQAEIRFDRILYIRLLSQGMFVLSIVAMMVAGTTTLENVVLCYVGTSVATSLLAVVLGWARLDSLRHRSRACMSELGHFGKYSVGSYVGSNILRSSDAFIINYLLGPAPLAVYNMAGRFMEVIDMPLRSFLATAMPALSAAFNQNRLAEVARLLRKNAGMLTWAFVPVILVSILVADLPVNLIGGAKYRGSEAANILRIFMGMAILFPIDRFTGVALDVVNQPRLNLIKVFVMLGFNIVGDVTAILLFHSIYGVALASIPTTIAGFVFGFMQLNKYLPLSLKGIIVTGFAESRALVGRVLGWPVSLASRQEP